MRNSCPQSVAAVFTPNTTRYPRDSTHRKGESRNSFRVLSLFPGDDKHRKTFTQISNGSIYTQYSIQGVN